MTTTERPAPIELGELDGITYSIAQTHEPWLLDIDAIVVSVGSGFGSLGNALRHQFDDSVWPTIPFGDITPQHPIVIALPKGNRTDVTLGRAVLVSPHVDGNESSGITDGTLATATRNALDSAATANARRIGMPLLGTGSLFKPAEQAARIIVPAAIDTMQRQSARMVDQLVFLCQDDTTADAITAQFTATVSGDSSNPTPLAGGVSTDLVDPNVGIPLNEDRLGVAPYVAMLATVIADQSTPLPLSVGIFGEWGSGKSYFMAMLRDRIHALAESGEKRYCREVVQISFNAWHYADSNLWASLGDEIFRQLAGTDAHSPGRADLIRGELAPLMDQRRRLEDATRQARTTATRLREEVDRAVTSRETSALNLLAAVGNTSSFRRTISSMWRKLGIDDESEQAALLVEQVQGTLSETAVLGRAATTKIGWISLAGAVTLLGLGILVPVLAGHIRDYSAWGAGLSATATGLGGLTFLASRIHRGLRRLRAVGEELRTELRTSAERSVSNDLTDTVARLRAAESEQRVAQAQLDDVIAHVGELGRELAELEPGRRLYSFLAERADSERYAGRLGLISTIRKDLEQLVDLMHEWRKDPDPASTRQPIDRIVLYIDDLDRCSAQQVVDVLQAVHLLLAFDLFVVVVGVDLSWLRRSLRSCYAEMLYDNGIEADRPHTPEDYIQKILNIPVMLPRMTTMGLSALLSDLAGPLDGTAESAAPQDAYTDRRPIGSTDPSVTAIPVEAGSEVAAQWRIAPGLQPPIRLTQPELALLGALDLFIDTPREAKRLLNVYRMVRTTRSLSPASRFLGLDGRAGEFEAVAILLALSTSRSHLCGAVLDTPPDSAGPAPGGLAHRPSNTRWVQFVADIEPQRAAVGWVNLIIGPIPDDQVPQWHRLHRGLLRASEVTSFSDLSDLQLWLPRLRRFSYTLAPSDTSATQPSARTSVPTETLTAADDFYQPFAIESSSSDT
ncbi:P-loop NTPase fold protein [Nocardia miyunensis]|uniref:P-loop NTPase fold protein n=1 Tax=Nocardia miyunensis TaxID=282684 RepID=UPI0008372D42|nr:P-loop NTPase fold protein [Nocardia miyunensis]